MQWEQLGDIGLWLVASWLAARIFWRLWRQQWDQQLQTLQRQVRDEKRRKARESS